MSSLVLILWFIHVQKLANQERRVNAASSVVMIVITHMILVHCVQQKHPLFLICLLPLFLICVLVNDLC